MLEIRNYSGLANDFGKGKSITGKTIKGLIILPNNYSAMPMVLPLMVLPQKIQQNEIVELV